MSHPEEVSPNEMINVVFGVGNIGANGITPKAGYPQTWNHTGIGVQVCTEDPSSSAFYSELALHRKGWEDGIYLSQSESFKPDSAVFLGSTSRLLGFQTDIVEWYTCCYEPLFQNYLPVSLPANCPGGIRSFPKKVAVTNVDTLQIGAAYQSNATVKLPANLKPGQYYLYIYTDYNRQVSEYPLEGNNILKSSNITVLSSDLTVPAVQADTMGFSGKPFAFQLPDTERRRRQDH
ncbi:MAG: hypothetical protein IPM98_15680 [Lewinellaceae bacterium]|nr:hypothetical protein [Lewinellaceae bacterium]